MGKAKDLRNKMYELKSAHTSKKLNIWWRKCKFMQRMNNSIYTLTRGQVQPVSIYIYFLNLSENNIIFIYLVDHKPGVPPLSVLIKMFPKVEESDLKNVSLIAYKALKHGAKNIYFLKSL